MLIYIFIAVANFIQTRHLLSCFLFYRLLIGASLVTMSAALSCFFLFLSYCITCQPTKAALLRLAMCRHFNDIIMTRT